MKKRPGLMTLLSVSVFAATIPAHAQGTTGASTGQRAVLPPTGNGLLPNPMPSSVAPPLQVPGSDRKISVTSDHINQQVDTAVSDANERLDGIEIGSGKLGDPKVDMTELEEELEAERKLRRMEILQKEAEAGMKLFNTTYDGKREYLQDNPPPASGNQAMRGGPGFGIGGLPASVPPFQAPWQSSFQQSGSHKEAKDDAPPAPKPYPIVSSITGMGNDLRAVILVPYVGVVTVAVGDTLPDTRHLKVVAIDSGVTVVDDKGQKLQLGNGGAVPSALVVESRQSGSGGPHAIR